MPELVPGTPVTATGPVVVTVTGAKGSDSVRITGDIGGGEALAYFHSVGDPTSLARLEFPAGCVFKVYVDNQSGSTIKVWYTYV